MNMKDWVLDLKNNKRNIPILSFPVIQLMECSLKEFLNNTKRFVNAVDEFYYRIKKLKSEEDRKNAKIVISQIDTLLFAFTGFIGVYDAIILLREKLSEQKRLSLADEIEFDIILKHYKEILKNFDCFIDACRADRIKK